MGASLPGPHIGCRRTTARGCAARARGRGAAGVAGVAGVAGQDRSAPAHRCGPCGPRIRSRWFRRATAGAGRADRRYPRRRGPARAGGDRAVRGGAYGVGGTARPSGPSGRTFHERRRSTGGFGADPGPGFGSSVVDVGPRSHCTSYIPRGPVADWSGSGAGSRTEPDRAGARSAAYHKGQVAYLKTFRLSDAQVRRGHLLHTLADADRQLAAGAAALGTTADELVRRIRAAGFEALLKARVQARVQPAQRPRITQETSVTRGSHSGNGREIASCEAALQRPDRRPQHRSTRKGWLP